MKKTLGGDRLGSGKKISVDLHNYSRSTHDKGYMWRSTMSPGTLVPFMSEVGLPGDTWDIELNTDVKTHPTVGPLFGSYKQQLDIFMAPIRLYNSALHNNMIGIGMKMEQILLPQIILTAKQIDPETVADIDNCQINPSSILAYLGIRGVGMTLAGDNNRSFCCVDYLAYWEIYKNYYANKQQEIGVVIHTPREELVDTVTSVTATDGTIQEAPTVSATVFGVNDSIDIGYTGAPPRPEQIIFSTNEFGDIAGSSLVIGWTDTGTVLKSTSGSRYGQVVINNWRYIGESDITTGRPGLLEFPLTNIDEIRQAILATPPLGQFNITEDTVQEPYRLICGSGTSGAMFMLGSQEGLGVKTYQSDKFNNWLNTEWIDGVGGINDISRIDTTGGFFTIDAFLIARKVFDVLNRIAVSGGTYDDWQDAVWAHNRYTKCESPMYMGGLSKEVVFQEVVSNSAAEGQPLATLAGRGRLGKKHKGGSITVKVDEPCYIIGIVSLTPRIDYSQGNMWDKGLKTMNDLHKPGLDNIGFEDLITEGMAWWDTRWNTTDSAWEQRSAGKQPAWINYMTNVNKTLGNFAIARNEMFMTLNRRYEMDTTAVTIQDLTTYIDPAKFNFIFAETAIDAQNFWVQIAVDITARRKMSAKIMPNL